MTIQSSDPPSEALLNAEGVQKRYGGVRALRGASLHVRRGEVHGLVGENGSGKSTMLKILSGQVVPDAGTVTLGRTPCTFGDPVASIAAGIATVTQGDHAGARPHGGGEHPPRPAARPPLVRRGMAGDAQARAGVARAPRARHKPARVVNTLRPDEQQMVEIARALSMDARVLILDEPTSSLTDDEVEALFRTVKRLRIQGVSTIFVSHRMKEIFSLVDSVTILRDGKLIASGPIGDYDYDKMIHAMVGKEPESFVHANAGTGEVERPMLRMRNLTVPGRVHDVSLDVAPARSSGWRGWSAPGARSSSGRCSASRTTRAASRSTASAAARAGRCTR